MQTEVVRACHTIVWADQDCPTGKSSRTGQDCPTGNSSRRETKRQTEETIGRQHQRVDWPRLSYSEQFKKGDEEADRGNDGKTTPKSGLALKLNGIYYYRNLRTTRSGGSWL